MSKADKEQAPPKPKVLFKMAFEIWDDGEITRDLVEKVQGERGAPKAWRMEPRDFISSVKATVGDKTKVFEALLKALDFTVEEVKKTYSLDRTSLEKADKIASAFSENTKDDNEEKLEEEFNFDTKE